eukprot:763005-Hanusia_phi.AAC.5
MTCRDYDHVHKATQEINSVAGNHRIASPSPPPILVTHALLRRSLRRHHVQGVGQPCAGRLVLTELPPHGELGLAGLVWDALDELSRDAVDEHLLERSPDLDLHDLHLHPVVDEGPAERLDLEVFEVAEEDAAEGGWDGQVPKPRAHAKDRAYLYFVFFIWLKNACSGRLLMGLVGEVNLRIVFSPLSGTGSSFFFKAPIRRVTTSVVDSFGEGSAATAAASCLLSAGSSNFCPALAAD